MRLEAEPASQADLVAFLGKRPPKTVRAWVWKKDGEAVAAAGYYTGQTRALMWSEIRDGAPKAAIWREAKRLMGQMTLPMVCVASPGAERFLERLGWTYQDESSDGKVYAWHS